MRLLGLEIRKAPLTPVSDNRGGWWPFIREPYTGAWQRNDEWTVQSVLAHPTVYACITRIAQDLGKLRQKLVELDDEDGIWTETSSAAFSPRLARPNRFQNHIQFKEWWATSKLSHGNTYALKERDGRSTISAIYILDPTRVTPMVSPDGEVLYDLKTDNLAGLQEDAIAVPASEIVHDRMNCLFHPLVGVSPIWSCGTSANMGLEIGSSSSSFFSNNATPSGVLMSPLPITAKQAAEMQEQWNSRYGPNGTGGVAVLGANMKFEPMTMSAQDSQLIEQLDWVSSAICTAFHVPPFKVGIGPMPSSENAEKLNQIYYSDCLQSHIEQYEACMDEMFGFTTPVDGRTLGIELDLDGLLRMDTASQIETLSAAVGGSLMRIDEARQKLDKKPVPGGDKIWMQQQNYSLEALDKRDRNDPFAKAPSPPAVSGPDGATSLSAPEPQKQLPASTEPRAVEEIESFDDWPERFYRDTLTIVREAQELQLRAVQDAIDEGRSAEVERHDNALFAGISASLAALATREAVAPIVNVAAPEIHVTPPSVNITMESPKPGTKTLVINKPGGETVTATVEES